MQYSRQLNKKEVGWRYKRLVCVFYSAIDTPMYEIRGTAIYKTNDGGCEPEIINAVKKLLPSFMRTVMCAEITAFGSYRYACNFYIETTICSQEKVINYIIILRFILIQFFFLFRKRKFSGNQ